MSPRFASTLGKITACFLLLACAPVTKISASKNPGYTGKIYQKILVEAMGPNPQQNVQLEWTFRSLFDQVRVPVANATQLFPTTAPENSPDRDAVLKREGIDGVLLVNFTNERRQTIYHPPTSTQTEVHKRKDGSTYITTTQSGDYTEHTMVQDHGLTFLDASTLQPVWVGSASTSGDFQAANEKDFFRSLARQSVKDLAQAGLIRLGAPLPKK